MPTVDIEQAQTFAAFEGKVQGYTVKGVSLLQKGPALGHGMWVDNVMLEQAKKSAQGKGKIKAKMNHWSGLEDTVGYYENFRIRAGKLVADLNLFESSRSTLQLLEMIESIPESFGVSIMFASDEAEYDAEEDKYFARVRELYSADFVDTPAANRDGVFEAEIDKANEDNMPTEKSAPQAPAFDAQAAIAALTAQVAELKTALETKPQPVEAPVDAPVLLEEKADELANIRAELAAAVTAIKAFAAAPPASKETAPPQEQADDSNPLEITRDQFEKIPVPERSAFFAKGGKLKA